MESLVTVAFPPACPAGLDEDGIWETAAASCTKSSEFTLNFPFFLCLTADSGMCRYKVAVSNLWKY